MYGNGLSLCVIRGNVTADPEMKFTPGGQARTTLRVAVNKRFKDRDGNKKEEVSFLPITCWGNLAERVHEWVKRGQEITVVGELRQDRWTNDEGKNMSFIHVVADRLDFGDKAKGKEEDTPSEPAEPVEELINF